MSSAYSELFVGPAVVVDDRINDPDAGMVGVLRQIEGAGLPLLKMTALPPVSQIRHWRGFALIVLDWDLFNAGEAGPGVSVPESLKEKNAQTVSEFVSCLLKDLYCPIFILSNEDTGTIGEELEARLSDQLADVESRVMIRSKASTEDDLFGKLGEWVAAHCAVYALKRWEAGYEDAKRDLFQDLQLGSARWPQILWSASEKDGVNPHFELTETISRNILHRFEPLVFDESVLSSEDAVDSGEEIRSVVHRRSVVDEPSLHKDVLMPGDFFTDPDGSDDGDMILINVTPACDLVPRSGVSLDDVQMTLLPATLVDASDVRNQRTREKLERKLVATEALIWVISTDALPYRVNFKGWTQGTWSSYSTLRKGRLLDPYITDLQQRFALHFHRQGLPRLPLEYYPSA